MPVPKMVLLQFRLDIKIDGLTPEIIKTALEMTRKGRIDILNDVMLPVYCKAQRRCFKYAPKIIQFKIDVDKIREVIGPGGKVIQKIIADTGVKIDIEDDGSVFIAATDSQAGNEALEIIKGIVAEPEIGTVYKGKVVRIMDFGAFVEFLPGKEGLVHISKLDHKRVEKVDGCGARGRYH